MVVLSGTSHLIPSMLTIDNRYPANRLTDRQHIPSTVRSLRPGAPSMPANSPGTLPRVVTLPCDANARGRHDVGTMVARTRR